MHYECHQQTNTFVHLLPCSQCEWPHTMSWRPCVWVSSHTVSPLTRHTSWYASWPIHPVYHRSGTVTLVFSLFSLTLVPTSLLPQFPCSYFLRAFLCFLTLLSMSFPLFPLFCELSFVSCSTFYELSFSLLCSSFPFFYSHTCTSPLTELSFLSYFSTVPFPCLMLTAHTHKSLPLCISHHLPFSYEICFSRLIVVLAEKDEGLDGNTIEHYIQRHHSLYEWVLLELVAVITPTKSQIRFLFFETTFHSQQVTYEQLLLQTVWQQMAEQGLVWCWYDAGMMASCSVVTHYLYFLFTFKFIKNRFWAKNSYIIFIVSVIHSRLCLCSPFVCVEICALYLDSVFYCPIVVN